MSNLSSFYPTGSGGSLRVRRNLIINGNFDIWQRGTTQNTTGYGSVDRWSLSFGGSDSITITRSPETANSLYRTNYRMKSVIAGGSGTDSYIIFSQKIEDVRTGADKTLSLSLLVYSTGVSNISLEMIQDFGSGGSADVKLAVKKFSLLAGWNSLTYTFSLPDISGKTIGSGNNLRMLLWLSSGSDWNSRTDSLGIQSGTLYFAQCQLEEGLTPSPYDFETYADTLQQCQRYYWIGQAPGSGYGYRTGNAGDTYRMTNNIHFPVTMRATPTVSIVTSPTYTNCSFYAIVGSKDSFLERCDVTANGSYRATNGVYDADAEL